jgi:hypothetical protein
MVPPLASSFGSGGGSGRRSRRERGPGSAGHSRFTLRDLGVTASLRGPWW